MPRPNQGTGQTSSLRSALSHPDPQAVAAFIESIANSYGETRDLTQTARAFGCERRTLERAMNDFPKLGEAIDAIRNRLAATAGH